MTTLFAATLSVAFLVLSAAGLSHAAGPAGANPTEEATSRHTVVFEVDNMTCATCPIAVKAAMKRVEGVDRVEIDNETKQASVTFDPGRTTTHAIAQASAQAGYPAVLRAG